MTDELHKQFDKSLGDCLEYISDIEIEKNKLEDIYSRNDLSIMKIGMREYTKEYIYKITSDFWKQRKPNNDKINYQCSICLIEITPIHGTTEQREKNIRLDYLSPCACSGINKYIHKVCYRNLLIRGNYECGVCKMIYPT